jgi:hypothetical protein
MWSLTSRRTKRIGGFRKFRLLPVKDFFDSIDPNLTFSNNENGCTEGEPKRDNGSAHGSKTNIPRKLKGNFIWILAPVCQLQDTDVIRDFEAALSGIIASPMG